MSLVFFFIKKNKNFFIAIFVLIGSIYLYLCFNNKVILKKNE